MENNPKNSYKINWYEEHQITYDLLKEGIDVMQSAHAKYPEYVPATNIRKMREAAKRYKIKYL